MSDPVGGDRFPSLHRERFICPHCAAFAGQYWAALGVSGENNDHEWLEASWDGDPFDERRTSRSTWNAAQCASCHQWSIWRESQMVHPQRQVGAPAHPDMPEGPRILYGEAAAVAAVSRRAGAAMARAALETLIKEIDAEAPRKARLEDRIGRLRGRVSTPLGKLLDVVRVTGNSALHQSASGASDIVVIVLDDEEGPELLALLLQAANDLVEELITRPRVVAALWQKLPEAVRDRSEFGDAPEFDTARE